MNLFYKLDVCLDILFKNKIKKNDFFSFSVFSGEVSIIYHVTNTEIITHIQIYLGGMVWAVEGILRCFFPPTAGTGKLLFIFTFCSNSADA